MPNRAAALMAEHIAQGRDAVLDSMACTEAGDRSVTDGETTISSERVGVAGAAADRRRCSHAGGLGKAFTIAVVDAAGVLKALERMDGAPLLSIQVAQDKAYTAVGFGMPTHTWHDFIKDDPPLADGATAGIDRLVIFGGGFPITSTAPCRRDRRERGPLLGGCRRRRSRAATLG